MIRGLRKGGKKQANKVGPQQSVRTWSSCSFVLLLVGPFSLSRSMDCKFAIMIRGLRQERTKEANKVDNGTSFHGRRSFSRFVTSISVDSKFHRDSFLPGLYSLAYWPFIAGALVANLCSRYVVRKFVDSFVSVVRGERDCTSVQVPMGNPRNQRVSVLWMFVGP